MIINYSLKDFARNLGFNIFIILQIALLLSACIFTCSSISQKLKYYYVFDDMLEKDGYYVKFTSTILSGDLEDKITLSDYVDYFDEASVLYAFLAPVTIKNASYKCEWTYAYRSRLIDEFSPLMSEGDWFKSRASKSMTVNAVISPNFLGIKAGDEFTQTFFTSDGTKSVDLTVHITGVFKDGAKLFGITYGTGSEDYIDTSSTNLIEDSFHNYYKDIYKTPLIIFDYDELEAYNVSAFVEPEAIVPLKDGLTDQQKKEAYKALQEQCSVCVPFEEINEASMTELKKELTVLLPIVLGLALLTVVSILSFTAITTHKQLRNYGTVCLCGATLTQCSFINLFEIAADLLLSALLSAGAFLALNKYKLLENTVVQINVTSILVCVAVGILILIISMVMPLIITAKTSLKEILTESGE